MPSSAYLLGALAVVFTVTVTLRALPFAVVGPLRSSPVIRFLGLHMPGGVMVILAVYTLKDVPLTTWPHALPQAIAVAVTVALHLWRANAVVSILGGTAAIVLYLLSPIDLIPEVIPILGVVDDLVIVPMALRWLLSRLPAHIREHAEVRASGANPQSPWKPARR